MAVMGSEGVAHVVESELPGSGQPQGGGTAAPPGVLVKEDQHPSLTYACPDLFSADDETNSAHAARFLRSFNAWGFRV